MNQPSTPGDDPLSVALDPANVLPRRIAGWAATEPTRPCLIEAETGRTATYRELWQLVGRWVDHLREHGVGRGTRVATLLPSSIDAYAVWLAVGLLRAHEVPINPELRGDFLRHVLTDASITTAVLRPVYVDVIERSGVDGLGLIFAPGDRLGPGRRTGDRRCGVDELPTPDDVACIIYTSGTTGPSKGVAISWAQMSANIGRIPRWWLSSEDAVYSPWPMFHVTGRSPMVSMADVGGRVVCRERFAVDRFWQDIRIHGCTSTTVGAVLSLLVAQPERPDDADNPLRLTLLGRVGRMGWEFLRRFDSTGLCFYGSTEVGFPIAVRPITEATVDVVGWPRPGYDARLVGDDGNEVADGDVGELWIRPADRRLILMGYLDRPDLTSSAVVDGWYRTGDAMRRREDGAYAFVDRMSDTIRRFGENISSSALEDVVVADDDIVECAAIGVRSEITGHDVALFVILREDADIEPRALAERLAERLPRYMRPSYVTVVDELARTPNGKIRKVGLEELIDESTWRAR